MKIKSYLALVAIVLTLIGCSSRLTKSEEARLSQLSDKSIREQALTEFNKRNYKKAINIYALVLKKKKPNIKHAAWAQYQIGFCYYYLEDFETARKNFEKVIKNYPQKICTAPRLLAAKLIKKIKEKRTEGI